MMNEMICFESDFYFDV